MNFFLIRSLSNYIKKERIKRKYLLSLKHITIMNEFSLYTLYYNIYNIYYYYYIK